MAIRKVITNFDYILLLAAIPFVLFIMAFIFSYVYEPLSFVLAFFSIASLFIFVFGFFVSAIVFGKTVKSRRREIWFGPSGHGSLFVRIFTVAVIVLMVAMFAGLFLECSFWAA